MIVHTNAKSFPAPAPSTMVLKILLAQSVGQLGEAAYAPSLAGVALRILFYQTNFRSACIRYYLTVSRYFTNTTKNFLPNVSRGLQHHVIYQLFGIRICLLGYIRKSERKEKQRR